MWFLKHNVKTLVISLLLDNLNPIIQFDLWSSLYATIFFLVNAIDNLSKVLFHYV